MSDRDHQLATQPAAAFDSGLVRRKLAVFDFPESIAEAMVNQLLTGASERTALDDQLELEASFAKRSEPIGYRLAATRIAALQLTGRVTSDFKNWLGQHWDVLVRLEQQGGGGDWMLFLKRTRTIGQSAYLLNPQIGDIRHSLFSRSIVPSSAPDAPRALVPIHAADAVVMICAAARLGTTSHADIGQYLLGSNADIQEWMEWLATPPPVKQPPAAPFFLFKPSRVCVCSWSEAVWLQLQLVARQRHETLLVIGGNTAVETATQIGFRQLSRKPNPTARALLEVLWENASSQDDQGLFTFASYLHQGLKNFIRQSKECLSLSPTMIRQILSNDDRDIRLAGIRALAKPLASVRSALPQPSTMDHGLAHAPPPLPSLASTRREKGDRRSQ